MTRRKFSRAFKTEAARLVTERGVAVAQAARDLDVAESVLRRWMRALTATPVAAFPGNGQMRADQAEIAALRKEVARLRAGRDILKKGEPCAPLVRAPWRPLFSRARRHEVRLHRQTSSHLAGQLALRGAGGLAFGIPRLAQPPVSARESHDAKLVTAIDKSFKASDRTGCAPAASGVTCLRTDGPAGFTGSNG